MERGVPRLLGCVPASNDLRRAGHTQSVNPSLALSSSDPGIIYSTTLDPSTVDCIEVTTVYSAGGKFIGAWDWCATSPGWAKTTPIDSTFVATYTTTVNSHPAYTVRDIQTNPSTNEWTAYLYNYTTGAWDTFYTSAGTAQLSNSDFGWDMAEVYTYYNSSTKEGYYCNETRGSYLAIMGLRYQLISGGNWTAATTTNSYMNLTIRVARISAATASDSRSPPPTTPGESPTQGTAPATLSARARRREPKSTSGRATVATTSDGRSAPATRSSASSRTCAST